MGFFSKNKNKLRSDFSYKDSNEKGGRNWKKIILIMIIILFLGGGIFAWKTGAILNKISTKGGVLESLIRTLPITNDKIRGEDEGRINILLLGMRGKNVPGGSFLADTIMILSIKPTEKQASLVSIPRDLYVNVPDQGFQSKINAVYHYGEERDSSHHDLICF